MKLRPTLQDIALKSGFSKTTASLALRNSPRIKVATRKLVQAIAREIGYRPDPALAQIAAHRWRIPATATGTTLAFVTTNHPRLNRILDEPAMKGCRRHAEAFGYRVEHFRLEDYAGAAQLGNVLYCRGIRGVILGQIMRHDFCPHFPWQHFSAVGCNIGFVRPPVHLVVPDHAHAVVEAWNRAQARGYRRIGVALFDERHAVDDFDKTAAVLYCQSRLGRGSSRIPLLRFEPGDHVALDRWLRDQRPDVVLGFNSSIYAWIQRTGFRVPQDIAFASLITRREMTPMENISGMDYPTELLGQAAFEQIEVQLRTNQHGIPDRPSALMVESHWVEGVTLPDRN